MNIFQEECDKELIIDEIVHFDQIEVVKEYGSFLALVGEDNFRMVASNLVAEIKKYNMANEGNIFSLSNKPNKKQINALKKAKGFRESLYQPDPNYVNMIIKGGGRLGKQAKKYDDLLQLLDEYIADLEEKKYEEWTVSYTLPFAEPYKKSKTNLTNHFNSVLKEYKINGYSHEIQQLLVKIDKDRVEDY